MSGLVTFLPALLASVVAGGLIGIEREWRGRPAGFRTHILVCLSCALLMQAAVRQGLWDFSPLAGTEIVSDPTRMAHGVLTGIGFLCAGVIFRTGFSIHGLTTAASLWITAVIGMLLGMGLFNLALIGVVITLISLILLRIVSKRLHGRTVIDVTVTWRNGSSGPRTAVERLLGNSDPDLHCVRAELAEEGALRRQAYRLRLVEADLNALGDQLAAVPGVCAFTLDPRDD